MITKQDVIDLFKHLDLIGKKVVVHSSFKCIGPVEGGPQTIVEGLLASFSTVMVPTTSYRSVSKHPPGDKPKRNGCDYAFYDNWDREVFPFDVKLNGIDKKMGVISELILNHPKSFRSATPWHSWTVIGEGAETLAQNNDWNNTDVPLRKIVEQDAWCVMIGVDLSTCSAIHLAEEAAGKKHFIRWCLDGDNKIKRVEAQGCGQGFNQLLPHCQSFIRTAKLGNATVMVFKLKDLVKTVAPLMIKNPKITMCSETCIRCIDTSLGGPTGELHEQ